ncbi:MAG TPA: hypothetical protein VM051_12635 [Usitatibacter sp.]|nr:hypothetical protein [Usitatibacter sp.]
MSKIVAGAFQVVTEAEEALRRLQDAGVDLDYICTFRVNPAGEHDRLPIGGDHLASDGSKHAHGGAATGAAVGAVIGGTVGAVAGPAGIAAGAGVGAYTGSLVGSLGEIGDEPSPDHADVRPACNLVAVNVDSSGVSEDTIVRTLEQCGALMVERAEGTWSEDAWADFDPTTRPNVIGGLEFARRADTQGAGNRPSV